MNEIPGHDRRQWVRNAMDAYETQLIGYVARIVNDHHAARDIVQETFLRLCREEMASLNGRLAPWLFTVCRNQALDLKRKESRMHTVDQGTLAGRPDGARDPSHAAEHNERIGTMIGALATLPDTQQEAVRLRFQHGLSYREIAEVMQITANHVGVLLHTALRKLREEFVPERNADGTARDDDNRSDKETQI